MDTLNERWDRIQSLFYEAVPLEPHDRLDFLATIEDETVRSEVADLLEASETGAPILERTFNYLAADILGDEHDSLTISRYRIERLIGKGGAGRVYLVHDPVTERHVAIKVLRDAGLSPVRLERFGQEKRFLAKLEHPNIARLYEASQLSDNTPYLVMEYVSGVPITLHCHEKVPEWQGRLRLFKSACEAVVHAHRHGLIHRDIKPSNVFVNDEGVVKLLDFGIAKHVEQWTDPDRPVDVIPMMTPVYAAPEQGSGGAPGLHTDVYGLGALLFEMLTGRPPFDFSGVQPQNLGKAIAAKVAGPPSGNCLPPPDGVTGATRRVWRDIDALCLKAMHHDPDCRYPTADALLRDVENLLDDKPLDAGSDTWMYRAGKYARRNRSFLSLTSFSTLLIVALVAFYTVALTKERDTALVEAEKNRVVSEYVMRLFANSSPLVNTDAGITVDSLLDRGVRDLYKLESQPLVQARMSDLLGRMHLERVNYKMADSLIRHAYDLRIKHRAAPPDMADSYQSLGMVFPLRSANVDSSVQYFLDALAIKKRTYHADHEVLAGIHSNLGTTYANAGKWSEAWEHLEEALRIVEANPMAEELRVMVLYNLATLHSNTGDYPGAEKRFRELVVLDSAKRGNDHLQVALHRIGLGGALSPQGQHRLAEALDEFIEALRVVRMRLGLENQYAIALLQQIGNLYRNAQSPDTALSYLEAALDLSRKVYGEAHPTTAISKRNLASLYRDTGQVDRAMDLSKDALSSFNAAHGNQPNYYSAAMLCSMGRLEVLRGRPDAAAVYLQEGFDMHILLKTDYRNPDWHECRIRYGEHFIGQGQFEDAERVLSAAYGDYDKNRNDLDAGGLQSLFQVARRLVTLYEAWGKPAEADPYRKEADQVKYP